MKNDIAYANADFIPGGADYPERWEDAAQIHREREAMLGRARLNHAYGDHPRQKLDMFHPAGRPEGLVVFIHGGYWVGFDRGYWSHFAAGLTARGWAVAMPSYPLAPEATIPDITQSARAAVDAAAALVAGPIRIAGHSAGGHLAARMAMADAAPEAAERIDHIVPISPVTDLRPLLETSMNAKLQLDADSATSESPALAEKALDVDVTVWVGAEERPAFLDQARWLCDAWKAPLRVAPGRHHFDVLDDLLRADGTLVRAILD